MKIVVFANILMLVLLAGLYATLNKHNTAEVIYELESLKTMQKAAQNKKPIKVNQNALDIKQQKGSRGGPSNVIKVYKIFVLLSKVNIHDVWITNIQYVMRSKKYTIKIQSKNLNSITQYVQLLKQKLLPFLELIHINIREQKVRKKVIVDNLNHLDNYDDKTLGYDHTRQKHNNSKSKKEECEYICEIAIMVQ